jgi:hypothetical protein
MELDYIEHKAVFDKTGRDINAISVIHHKRALSN